MKNDTAYCEDRPSLTEMLLSRLERTGNRNGDMVYCEAKGGRVEHLGCCDGYRLFFLLEGKVHLKGDAFGKHLLSGQEFILLPPFGGIKCSVLAGSKYILMTCSELTSAGNISCCEQLREYALLQQEATGPLPVRDKLERILRNISVYTTGSDHYPVIYDTVFMILRSLYTMEEMASLLRPMLAGRGHPECE